MIERATPERKSQRSRTTIASHENPIGILQGLSGIERTCFMSRAGPSPVRNVTVTIDGVTHHGAYFVQGSMVYVRSTLGAQATKMVAARNNCNVAALGAG